MKSTSLKSAIVLLLLSGCASEPKVTSPEWIRTPTRTVDSGYIVYVGTGEDPSPEKSKFKAESAALQDLANECSFPPKGTRIEDHFQEKSGTLTLTYAKVGISFIDCDAAKSANDTETIRKVANVSLTEELKQYQDLVYAPSENGENDETHSSEVNPMANSLSAPPEVTTSDHYFVVRQRVAFIKRDVILEPTSIPVATTGSPQPRIVGPDLTKRLELANSSLRTYETSHPEVKNWHHSWSEFDKNQRAVRAESRSHGTKSIAGRHVIHERPGIGSKPKKVRKKRKGELH